MDNLTRDAVAAKKAGMTYGQWKAMQEPAPIVPAPRGVVIKTCEFCGTEFRYRNNRQRKYCSDECKIKMNYLQMRAKKMAAAMEDMQYGE